MTIFEIIVIGYLLNIIGYLAYVVEVIYNRDLSDAEATTFYRMNVLVFIPYVVGVIIMVLSFINITEPINKDTNEY